MSDMTDQFLQNQMEILRDIREELRAGRNQSGMVGGASNGRTFTQAQSAIDKTLSGEWSTLGWTNAYSSTYRSSFIGDVAAIAGFQRAPETLTQQEFQALAGQNIMGRLGSATLGLFAPGFNSRSNALADEIYSHSGRFIRFGNSAAGVTGAGFNFDVARSLGRQVNLEALGDLRLSQKDYGTITSLGMQSGQFDQAGSTDDFKRKVRELASATGDLTRALHMTVQEVGTAMGNMRMLGVTSVGQQRTMLMQAGSAAMVAGMSAPEMLGFAGGVASQGLSLGLGAQSTFGLGANNMAMVRSMSASGLLQNGLVAMGGGAAAIAQNISSAQMNFAASNAGMLAFMGGGAAGGNSVEAMLRGLGKAGGTFEDMVSLGYDRVKNLSGMTADDISGMFAGRIRTQLGMVGVSDMTSRLAQGMAFRMARGMGMEDAAAHVFVQGNFSEEGLRNTDATRIQGRRAQAFREQQVAYDKYLYRNSVAGRVRSGIQSIGAALGGMVDSGMGLFESKQGTSLFGFSSGEFANDFDALMSGGRGPSEVGIAEIANTMATANSVSAAPLSISIRGGGGTPGSADWMNVGAGMAAGSGGLLKPMLAGAAMHYTGSSDTVFTDTRVVQEMSKVVGAVNNGSSRAAQSQIAAGTFKGEFWNKLTDKLDRSKMTAMAFADFSHTVTMAAKEMQISEQEVVNGFLAVGGDVKLPDMVTFGDSKHLIGKGQLDAIGAILGDAKHLTNMATSTNSAAMRDYLGAVSQTGSTNNVSSDILQRAVAASGSAENFDRIRDRVKAELATQEGRGRLAEAVKGFGSVSSQVARSELNRTFDAARGFAGELITGSKFDKATSESIRSQLSDVEGGRADFLSVLNDDKGAMNKAAMSGSMGALFKAAAGVASNDTLNKMSAAQIAHEYHIRDVAGIDAIKKNNPGMLRNAIQASLLGENAVRREEAVTQPARSADLLHKAAVILDRLDTNIKGGQ